MTSKCLLFPTFFFFPLFEKYMHLMPCPNWTDRFFPLVWGINQDVIFLKTLHKCHKYEEYRHRLGLIIVEISTFHDNGFQTTTSGSCTKHIAFFFIITTQMYRDFMFCLWSFPGLCLYYTKVNILNMTRNCSKMPNFPPVICIEMNHSHTFISPLRLSTFSPLATV